MCARRTRSRDPGRTRPLMRFTFLHAADLHLGSPLSGPRDEGRGHRAPLRGGEPRGLRGSGRTRRSSRKVAFVLIAGDVYDGDWKDTSIGLFFNREVARLDRAGIPVFLIRGNHDAESEITKAVSLAARRVRIPDPQGGHAPPGRLEGRHPRAQLRRPGRAARTIALAYPAPRAGLVQHRHAAHLLRGLARHTRSTRPARSQDLVAAATTIGRWAMSTSTRCCTRTPGSSIRAICRAAACANAGRRARSWSTSPTDGSAALRPLVLDQARWLHCAIAPSTRRARSRAARRGAGRAGAIRWPRPAAG